MKVSYNWLQTYFAEPLPTPEEVSEALTFHAWEIEEMEKKGDDTVIDVKVLPDKSPWALCHRGIAKDLSVILSRKLANDPLATEPNLSPLSEHISIEFQSDKVRRYTAVLIEGVTVTDSPQWLKEKLQVLGQKPINNIVDATNYVMFGVGQPLHAFDAAKLGNPIAIVVRDATDGEEIETLSNERKTLTKDDLVIANGNSGAVLGVAGVKGGTEAMIDGATTTILIESANFDPVSVRKTAQRHKLRTDASARFENGIVPSVAAYAMAEVVKLILDIAGGKVAGYQDNYPHPTRPAPVSVATAKINSVLSLALTEEDIRSVMDRFSYPNVIEDGILMVTPPIERPDLMIGEDVIEEIGRIYGYEHIGSVPLPSLGTPGMNKAFYYAERIRDTLAAIGFSEVFTSSFRSQDEVKLANALAQDKGYLRSNLSRNIDEVLAKNAPLCDLLGIPSVRVFEIGTVFPKEGEHLSLAVGVRSAGGYKVKIDEPVLKEAITALEAVLATALAFSHQNGIAEANLTEMITALPQPSAYQPFAKREDPVYHPFSPYPSMSRDIALWVPAGVEPSVIEEILRKEGGGLVKRITLFDRFEKDGKTSYAFRLVFQSNEKTLEEGEVQPIMGRITGALHAQEGFVVR